MARSRRPLADDIMHDGLVRKRPCNGADAMLCRVVTTFIIESSNCEAEFAVSEDSNVEIVACSTGSSGEIAKASPDRWALAPGNGIHTLQPPERLSVDLHSAPGNLQSFAKRDVVAS